MHLDGYDQRDLIAGKGPDRRHEFFYWTDDGDLAGLRYDQYKVVFIAQPAHGLERPGSFSVEQAMDMPMKPKANN